MNGGDQANESEQVKGGDPADVVKAKEATDDNEQAEASDKAEKGKVVGAGETAVGSTSRNVSGSHATVDDLPEVPKAEPSTGDEPESKRQKQQQPSDS